MRWGAISERWVIGLRVADVLWLAALCGIAAAAQLFLSSLIEF